MLERRRPRKMTLSMSHDALTQSYAVQFQAVAGSSNSPLRSGEIIHSGQFMVSDFEAEAQDEDDNEIKMPDPDDPNLEREPGPVDGSLDACTAVQRYAPRYGVTTGAAVLVSSRVEIDTTLAKLFKCMNLAYSQKLTSPKWNHFKGVRLRWKDKIRLNNVIWRCWHMQFFLKKRTPVCQFASPLDVDIHSNPQTVVLEGKYWKRQLVVIKAEYRKWRRNFKSNAIGTLTCDSKSEFDFSELQLPNDRLLMLTDDWSDDSLFSAINGPFPFPDPREIARDAGRADFIQPSLGPLQPNIDDIDLSTFHELLNFRLPPVPEEGAEDMLKGVDFYPIMGSERMDSTNIEEMTGSGQSQSMGGNSLHDASMLDMNALGTIRYTGNMEIDHHPSQLIDSHGSENNRMMGSCDYRNQMLDTNVSKIQNSFGVVDGFPITTNAAKQTDNLSSIHTNLNQCGGHNNNNNRNILIGRITKSRKINYDKAQPTTHQTLLYQQMLAEQQEQQQRQQHLQQQQSAHQHSNQQQMINSMEFSHQFSNASVLSAPGNFSSPTSNVISSPELKSYSFPQQSANFQLLQQNNSPPSDILSMLSSSPDTFKMQKTSPNATYRMYNAANFKKGASSAGYINLGVQSDMRQNSPPGNNAINQYISNQQQQQQQSQQILQRQQQQQQQQLPQTSQQLADKEMYRSNSLALNASLPQPKGDNFAVPKYHIKSSRSRTRSNSMQQSSGHGPSPLQPALSEPLLNKSTLAQLLTSNNNTKLVTKQITSTSAITSLPPSGFSPTYSSSNNMQSIVQTQQLTQSSVIKQQHISPTRSVSLPQTSIQSSSSDNKVFNFSGSSLTPSASFSPESYADPGSPLSPTRSSSTASQLRFPRDNQRRAGHIHAEQKRRGNIKDRFDLLHSLIPQLQQNPNPKLSKAATLQKAAEYIKQLNGERNVINEKIEALRKERDSLNASLLHLQSILPANGAPVSRQKTEQVKQLYNQYVRYKTKHTWKFWILGLILEPLISSYTTTVSVASIEELYRTALLWVDQHCSLVELRPAVSNKLRYLSTTTDILSEPPSSLEEEVNKAINNASGEHPNLTSS